MATTAVGYPYPVGTDKVQDGDNAIQALAEAVDTKLRASAAGTTTLSLPTASSTNTVAVTFPAGRFTAAPIVVIQRVTGYSVNATTYYWPSSVTTAGFNLNGQSSATGGAATVAWVAIQP